MKTQSDIEQTFISLFASLQNKVTNFSIGGVARALITAISALFAEAWSEINSILRKLFPTTAKSTDLDNLFAQLGVARLGAYYASVILVFKANVYSGASSAGYLNGLTDGNATWTPNQFINGIWVLVDFGGNQFVITGNTATQLTVVGTPASGQYYILPKVPAGTVVTSSVDGIGYTTQADVIVGLDNPSLLGQSNSISLGDRCIAVCNTAGEQGAAQAGTITVLSPAIPGITSVTNPVPTQPRSSLDAETDDAYRTRTQQIISLLNQGTQAFFEALAVAANSNVVRAISQKDFTNDGVILILANRGQAIFSGGDLTAIEAYVENNCRDFQTVTAENMTMTDIVVTMKGYFLPGTVLKTAYTLIADAIANFLDYSKWPADKVLQDYDVFNQIELVNSIVDIDLPTFTVQAYQGITLVGQKSITFNNSFPRLARLTMTDLSTNTTIDLVLSQVPVNVGYIPAVSV